MKHFALVAFLFSGALGAKVQYHRDNVLNPGNCLPGWLKNQSTGKCDDIDECALKNHTCNAANPCKNTPGSFQCLCSRGYAGTLPACQDIDECKIGNHTCKNNASGIECKNTKGSFLCQCKTGWEGLRYVGFQNTATCQNQNECVNATHNCHANATCRDTLGSFACVCNAGWQGNGTTCTDVDECTTNRCHFKHGAVCNNTVGSYTCDCRTGYTDVNGVCTNQNECNATDNTTSNNCNANANCVDTDGSFWCQCNGGWSGDGVNCTDVNECARPNACGHLSPLAHSSQCNNTIGSFQCLCQAGWEANNASVCLNVNECANSSLNTCAANASNCTDTQGSFFCTCLKGFAFNTSVNRCDDINECNTTLHGCFKQGQGCKNTFGSFECQCAPGYISGTNTTNFTNNSLYCLNVNECTNSSHNCNGNGTCTDSFGSFSCECNAGFIGDGITCESYDACLFKHDDCDKNAFCNSTGGSFTCSCNSGWSGNGTNCSNINECGVVNASNVTLVNATDNCHSTMGECTDTPGSFICTCKVGYLGDGQTCLDINECTSGLNNCPGNTTCSNTDGSFTCPCNTGYRMVNVSVLPIAASTVLLQDAQTPWHIRQVAVDINECMENAAARAANSSVAALCHSNATCNNTAGSYECICKAGWSPTGNGVDCQDVDECKVGTHKCNVHAYCLNTNGNYTCRCKPGYKGTGWGTDCQDIDECHTPIVNSTLNRTMCNSGAYCNNTVGSFTCTCLPGYFGDGVNCLNKDECRLKVHNCHSDYLCTDTTGSFTCECPTGYANWLKGKGNGTFCTGNKTVEVGQFMPKFMGGAADGTKSSSLDWQKVNFNGGFWIKPVVVVQVPNTGPRPVTARLRRITTKGFQVAISFPSSDNTTADQRFYEWMNTSIGALNFIAAVPGNTTLPDGTIVNAGLMSPSGVNRRSTPCAPQEQRYWDTATFVRNFTSKPVLFSALQTTPRFVTGGLTENYCDSAVRYNPAKNNTVEVAMVCHSDVPGPTVGRLNRDVIGWIALGGNGTASTNFSYNANLQENGTKTVSHSIVETSDVEFNTTSTGAQAWTTSHDISYGRNIDSPIVLASKVTLDQHVVGWMNVEGVLNDKAVVRVNEDKCALTQPRKEYFTSFIASEAFSV